MAEDKSKSDKPSKIKKVEKKAAPAKAEAAADKPAKAKKAKEKSPSSPKRAPLAPQTKFARNGEYPDRWMLVDATNQTLGRLCSFITMALMGKNKPHYTPNSDQGDHVVVINAEKVRLTGRKVEQKQYHYHTNYPGGIKTLEVKNLLQTKPQEIIERAVWGMLPKSKGHLARHWHKKLMVYAGPNHPHSAQKPELAKLPNLGIHE